MLEGLLKTVLINIFIAIFEWSCWGYIQLDEKEWISLNIHIDTMHRSKYIDS